MESGKYRKLLNEVFGLMKGEKLDAALQESKSAARVDAVQDLMRAAIIRSSICKFNGTPYYFSGRIYEEMAWDDFGNLIYDLMRKCKMPNGDYSRVEGVPLNLQIEDRIMAARIKSCTASTRAALLDSCKAASSFSPFISPKTSFNNFLYFPDSIQSLNLPVLT